VTAPVLDRSEVAISPGFAGFADLAERIGLDLEPFQHRIAKAALSGERELLILLPRGNGKTCLQALVALHHLLTVDDAEVFCCASSRDQARILFQYASASPARSTTQNVVHRHLELRWCPDPDARQVFTRFLRGSIPAGAFGSSKRSGLAGAVFKGLC
jgi:hypothetical protein